MFSNQDWINFGKIKMWFMIIELIFKEPETAVKSYKLGNSCFK